MCSKNQTTYWQYMKYLMKSLKPQIIKRPLKITQIIQFHILQMSKKEILNNYFILVSSVNNVNKELPYFEK